jgi:proteasome lid subunit RPN8/RPN11
MSKWEPNPHESRVHRTLPLPIRDLRGSYLVVEPILQATREALLSFALAGIHDGGHEGMLFWAGREANEATIILQGIVPDAMHSSQRVMANREAVGEAARVARANGLGILCQVHSHPGGDTRHSDGDDNLILLPFEGMLSLVVPNFGIGFESLRQASVHQFQDGKWILCSAASVEAKITIIPNRIDLRV